MEKILMNNEIRTPYVLLVGNGKNERMGRREAVRLAEEQGMDLVMVSPGKEIPVVKIMDGNKYVYEIKQKQKANRKNSKIPDLKEIRISTSIADNDMNTKATAARKFLEKGHDVKFSLMCRGREISRIRQVAPPVFQKINELLSDVSETKQTMKINGRTASVILGPKKQQ